MESFGRYLSRQRELRGMTRAEVVRLTRLSPLTVDALEDDRFDVLPARVFVVGYLRIYASAIGMNPDEAVLRFEEWAQSNPDAASPPPAHRRRRTPRAVPWRAIGIAAGILALAALGWCA